MEALGVLVGLCCLLFFAMSPVALVLSVVALRRVRSLAADQRRELDEVRIRLLEMERLRSPTPPPAPLGTRVYPPSRPAEALPERAPAPAPPEPPPLVAAQATDTRDTPLVEELPEKLPTPPEPPAPAPPEKPSLSLESFGVWAVSVLGGLFLLVGAIFAFRIAIEKGWVGPAFRYSGGLVAGALALVLSEALWARRYKLPAAALAGGGIGALYAALYAGHSLYRIAGTALTFGLMVAVTGVGVLLAIRRNSQFVAILGLAGGFLTPILLSTGVNRAPALFSYVGLLVAGVLLAAAFRGWWLVALLAGPATLAIHVGWGSEFGALDQVPVALASSLGLMGLFLAFALRRRSSVAVSVASYAGAVLMLFAALPFVLPELPYKHEAGVNTPTLAGLGLLLAFAALQAVARLRGWRAASLGAGLAMAPSLLAFVSGWAFEETQPWGWILSVLVVGSLLPWLLERLLPSFEDEDARLELVRPLLSFGLLTLGSLPFLFSKAEPVHMLGLAGIWAASTWAMALAPRRAWFSWVGLAGVLAGVLAAMDRADSLDAGAGLVLAVGLAFVALYLVLPFVIRGLAPDRDTAQGPSCWLASALAGPVLFLPIRQAWIEVHGDALIGLLPLLLGAGTFGAALAVREKLARKEGPEGEGTLVLYVAVSLLFGCVAVPLQLSNEWLTVGWALEGAALAWLSLRMRHGGILVLATVLFAAVGLRLVVNPEVLEYHAVASRSLLNWTLYGYGVPALALLAGAALRARPEPPRPPEWDWVRYLPRAWTLTAIAVLFALVNLEVSYAFAEGTELALSGNTLAAAMTRSISWALFGLALLAFGWSPRRRWLRPLALLFLMLASLKVFLSDLWNLSGAIRVGSLFGVAVVLILAGIGFQRLILRSQDTAGKED